MSNIPLSETRENKRNDSGRRDGSEGKLDNLTTVDNGLELEATLNFSFQLVHVRRL